jgi:hypothetical protein
MGMHGLALTGVGEVVDVQELLGAQVEGAGDGVPGRRRRSPVGRSRRVGRRRATPSRVVSSKATTLVAQGMRGDGEGRSGARRVARSEEMVASMERRVAPSSVARRL